MININGSLIHKNILNQDLQAFMRVIGFMKDLDLMLEGFNSQALILTKQIKREKALEIYKENPLDEKK